VLIDDHGQVDRACAMPAVAGSPMRKEISQSQGEACENVTILPNFKLRRKLKYLDLSAQDGAGDEGQDHMSWIMLASQRSGRRASLATVTGRVKRRGPALPGLT
jgi:hypothetical protein